MSSFPLATTLAAASLEREEKKREQDRLADLEKRKYLEKCYDDEIHRLVSEEKYWVSGKFRERYCYREDSVFPSFFSRLQNKLHFSGFQATTPVISKSTAFDEQGEPIPHHCFFISHPE